LLGSQIWWINAAIEKLSQPTDEEERGRERVDDGNKSSSKEDKMEEQEKDEQGVVSVVISIC
jgi:hypothetical protein